MVFIGQDLHIRMFMFSATFRCGVCEEGFYYSSSSNTCDKCARTQLNPFAAAIVGVTGLLFGVWLINFILKQMDMNVQEMTAITSYYVMTRILVKALGIKDENREEKISLFLQKLKIYITLCQILSSLVIVFNAVPPINFSRITNVFSILVSP